MTENGRIAIVTGADAPTLTDDGRRLERAIERRGYGVEAARWDYPATDWDRYEAAVIRSCWRYYIDPDRFRDWLATLERLGVTVCNPLEAIRWNMHKSYLRELGDAGVSIVPTAAVPDPQERDLATILADRGWDAAVVKPAIGTSSAGAWKTTSETAAADQDRFERPFAAARRNGTSAGADDGDRRLSRRGALVQQFVPEVAHGEHSLVFFGGEYSHAWRGLRTPDSFGVSANFEESSTYTPSTETISWGRAVLLTAIDLLDVVPDRLPYARVDFLCRNGERLLLELELIEPYLDLPGPDAADRLAASLAATF